MAWELTEGQQVLIHCPDCGAPMVIRVAAVANEAGEMVWGSKEYRCFVCNPPKLKPVGDNEQAKGR